MYRAYVSQRYRESIIAVIIAVVASDMTGLIGRRRRAAGHDRGRVGQQCGWIGAGGCAIDKSHVGYKASTEL